jgi:hypothetical protein
VKPEFTQAVYDTLRGRLGQQWIDGRTNWRVLATFNESVIVQRGTILESYPVTDDGKSIGEPKPVEPEYGTLRAHANEGTILGPVIDEETKSKPGSKWLVCAIAEGLSKNRTLYPAEVLQDAAPLYEGAKVFWDHAKKGGGRDPRDLAGFLSGARFGALAPETTKGATRAMVLAVLNVTAQQLREQLLEAYEAGNPELLGLSHSAACEVELVRLADGAAKRVKRIRAVESVDVVSFPSAGGRVMRLVAGLTSPVHVTDEELQMLETKIAKLKESRPDLHAKLGAEPTEAQVDALLLEAIGTQKPAPVVTPPVPATGMDLQGMAALFAAMQGKPVPAPSATLSEADQRTLHEAKVDRLLKDRTMPMAVLDTLRESLYARVGESEDALKAEVERTVKMAARMAPKSFGSGMGVTTEGVIDEADKLLEGVDGFFMSGASDSVKAEYKKLTGHDVPREGFRSFRRLYEAITGDQDVSGYIQDAQGLRRFNRLMEAIQTGTFTNLLGDSITRRMLSEYRATDYSQRWRRVCSRIGGINDFRTQERLRWGSFADLGTVAQLQPYPELANPTDEKISYAPAKRGGIVSISREAVKNDDVGFVRELPQKLAFAAARTLHKFVFDLIVTNPTLDDGVALFFASTARGFSSAGNIQTAALSGATVSIARQRLLKVRDRDNNTVLGLSPKILIVPPELEEIGWRLTTIPQFPISAQTSTEPNLYRAQYGLNELMVLETLTDATDYFILADPSLVNTIEIGFVDDQQEPALFTQNREDTGSVFSADALSWKVRHEYGGDVMDWRGMQGGIVA